MMEELILIELNSNDYDKSNYFTLLFISKNSNPTNFTERIYIYIYICTLTQGVVLIQSGNWNGNGKRQTLNEI